MKNLEKEKNIVNELERILIDAQKETVYSNKMKDKIIILLIVLIFAQAVIGYCGFVWYEAQFDYAETTTEETTISTEGDNANAEYNQVDGDQYNDNAVHEEKGGGD